MLAILFPLLSVFGVMLAGFIVQKLRVLPVDSDNVLNQYVYFVAFPAIMLVVLAETPIEQITDWNFMSGYGITMLIVYVISLLVSLFINKKRHSLAAIRALNTTFGNTSFIGIPLMMMLYPANQLALTAAAITSLLSVIMFAVVLTKLTLFQDRNQNAIKTVLLALTKNPIIIASLIGISLSAAHIEIFKPLRDVIHQLGITSSPCALFAIGMGLCSANQRERNVVSIRASLIELALLNLGKLIIQPIIAYLLLKAFGVSGDLLQMGILLAALPTAASVYLLAHRYQVNATISAQNISLGIVLSFATVPLLDLWLQH